MTRAITQLQNVLKIISERSRIKTMKIILQGKVSSKSGIRCGQEKIINYELIRKKKYIKNTLISVRPHISVAMHNFRWFGKLVMDTATSHKRPICTTQPWQFMNLKRDVLQSQSNRRLCLDPPQRSISWQLSRSDVKWNSKSELRNKTNYFLFSFSIIQKFDIVHQIFLWLIPWNHFGNPFLSMTS